MESPHFSRGNSKNKSTITTGVKTAIMVNITHSTSLLTLEPRHGLFSI